MRLDSGKECLKCDFCSSLYFPEANADGVRVFGDPGEDACPVCDVVLVHAAIGGERVFYCENCRGMLVPMGSFLVILNDLRARRGDAVGIASPPDWNDLNRHIDCPRCRVEMDTHPYGGGGGVIIDTCSECSVIWLDASEMARMARVPDRAAVQY